MKWDPAKDGLWSRAFKNADKCATFSELSSEGIFEIRQEGKCIVLQYNNESAAIDALMKLWDEHNKLIGDLF